MKEILSDDEKLQKSREEVEKATKEKASAPSSSDQQSSLGEGSGSDQQEPEKEEGEELTLKEVSFARLNTKDKVLLKALSEALDLCYQQDNLSMQYVRGAIMNILSTPTAAQIHGRKLFKLSPPGNQVMDDIHSHWESYLYDFRALANAPYSQFCPKEGWDAVYTWETLEKHKPTFFNSFGKKATKAFINSGGHPNHHRDKWWLFPQQTPQSCLHQAEVSLFWSPRCLGKGVASKWWFALTVECYLKMLPVAAPTSGGTLGSYLCVELVWSFIMRLPRSSKDHLGKCKEALTAKAAADLAASQDESNKERKA